MKKFGGILALLLLPLGTSANFTRVGPPCAGYGCSILGPRQKVSKPLKGSGHHLFFKHKSQPADLSAEAARSGDTQLAPKPPKSAHRHHFKKHKSQPATDSSAQGASGGDTQPATDSATQPAPKSSQ